MQIITLSEASRFKFEDLTITLGTFDGLHIGHMKLINAVKETPGHSAVFTFGSISDDIPFINSKFLFSFEEKVAAFKKRKIDYLCLENLNQKFAELDQKVFISMIMKAFSPQKIIVGYNYTYGWRALGNVNTLKDYCADCNCITDVIPPVVFNNIPVSSSRIRDCISSGNIEGANDLLGYQFYLSGFVVKVTCLGRQLGFSAANIAVPKEKIIPSRGVYSVDVSIGNDMFIGICNIGINSTVSNELTETIEVHIFSMSKNIIDEKIRIYFKKRLRDDFMFNNTTDLIDTSTKYMDSLRSFLPSQRELLPGDK